MKVKRDLSMTLILIKTKMPAPLSRSHIPNESESEVK